MTTLILLLVKFLVVLIFSRFKNVKAAGDENHLKKRELEIIRLIADGLTNKAIAAKLFLSNVTVNTHRKNMLAKMQLKNTASLGFGRESFLSVSSIHHKSGSRKII
ncbi:MAG: LuxR C-terminal-related transcriptional regulator [Parafilimonas sp.]